MAERKEVERLEAERLEAERKAERLEAERLPIKSQETELEKFVQVEPATMSENEENDQSESGCKYYFGYLCERDKGEEIPVACLECPKSLDCMLNNYKSRESVAEIKKWYPFKR